MELIPVVDQAVEGQAELEQLEKVIATGYTSYIDVGKALKEIEEKKYYQIKYDTFEAYYSDRWEFKRAHAYRLINAAKVIENLSPIGDILPITESQVRPLTRLKTPEKQREAWLKVIETAPNGKITAAHVERIVMEMLGKTEPVAPPVEPINKETGVALATMAISALEKISFDDPERVEALQMVQEWLDQNKAALRAAA